MIQVKNLVFSYPGQHELLFDRFNLELGENKIYGLLGKNGTPVFAVGLVEAEKRNSPGIGINPAHARGRDAEGGVPRA